MTDPITEHHGAPAPSKSTGTINLQWGMLSVPLSVFNAAEGETKPIDRHEYTAADHPVGRRMYDKETGDAVASSDVVKKATSSTGKLVAIDDSEIAAITGGRNAVSEIEAFVPLESIHDGTYLTEGVLQARPGPLRVGDKKLPNPAGEKVFALICGVMAERNVAALFRYAPGKAARFAALLPDGRILQVAWARQNRAPLALAATELSEAELAMGGQLLDTVGVTRPVLVDHSFEALQKYVDDKAEGVVETAAVAVAQDAPIVDLGAMLQASLAAAETRAQEIVEDAIGETITPAPEPEEATKPPRKASRAPRKAKGRAA